MAELDRIAICGRIKQVRNEAGLTQPEFADVLGFGYRAVQTWEAGRVPWERLDAIAKVGGRTKEWLLHGDPEPIPLPVEVMVGYLERIEQVLEALVARLERDALEDQAKAGLDHPGYPGRP